MIQEGIFTLLIFLFGFFFNNIVFHVKLSFQRNDLKEDLYYKHKLKGDKK